uniref:F-box domain-containing protein n=1 Tax=Cacopsylla melanoneura TaxID=428564 RepID=A0A8D8YJJ4_9HEMI
MGDTTATCIMDHKETCSKNLDLKRSLSGEIDHGVKKKFKTDDSWSSSPMRSVTDLSDDVLLILLSHIPHNDLINLGRTCRRLDGIVRDWTLWKTIDSHDYPIRMTQLKEFIPYILDCTEEVKLSFQEERLVPGAMDGDPELIKNHDCIVCLAMFLSHLNQHCSLTSLCLEYVTLDARKCQIQTFPPTLKKFSLAHSKLVNISSDVSYFYGFDTHFPNIEVLDLSWCNWFTPHSLIALSKSKNLQELYLQGCRKIKNCVPYTSLSVRFGFKALKILDLRFTYISDSEVSIIYDLPCLNRLYLAAPSPNRLEEFSISDRSITMLCTSSPRIQGGYDQLPNQFVRNANASVRLLLVPPAAAVNNEANVKVTKSFHTLVVTGYPSITDITLRHAAACLSGLKLLDVRGSSCTPDAIAQFRLARPEVTLLAGPDPEPAHPPSLVFDPPSPIPLLPGLRVVLHRIENQPVVAVNVNMRGNGEIAVEVGRNNNNNNNEEERNGDPNEGIEVDNPVGNVVRIGFGGPMAPVRQHQVREENPRVENVGENPRQTVGVCSHQLARRSGLFEIHGGRRQLCLGQ